MLSVISAGVHLAPSDPQFLADLRALLEELTAFFSVQPEPAPVDNIRLLNRDGLCIGIAGLCSDALSLDVGDQISELANNLLLRCAQQTPWAVKDLAEVPTDRLVASAADLLSRCTPEWLLGRGESTKFSPDEYRNLALHVCWHRVAMNPSDGIPDEWLDSVCAFTMSDSRLLAYNACSVLEFMFRTKKLCNGASHDDRIRRIARALDAAARDPRAYVRGQAAAAVVHAVGNDSLSRQLLDGTLDRLRHDEYSEVVIRLQMADADHQAGR
jgi:hypothetical protein